MHAEQGSILGLIPLSWLPDCGDEVHPAHIIDAQHNKIRLNIIFRKRSGSGCEYGPKMRKCEAPRPTRNKSPLPSDECRQTESEPFAWFQ